MHKKFKRIRLEEAEKEEDRYYQSLTVEERIKIFETLRRRYAAILGRPFDRVERVLKIVKQTPGEICSNRRSGPSDSWVPENDRRS